MASLERVELVTSRVEGVPDHLKMENLSQQTISLFVPDFTASTVEILLGNASLKGFNFFE